MKKKALILGISWEQFPIIKRVKELGFYVIAAGINPDSESYKLADITYLIDPLNFLEIDRIFQRHNPECVVTDACDYSLLASAFLSHRYKVAGPKLDTALACNNKYLQRKLVKGNTNVFQPEFKLCETYQDLLSFVIEYALPVVIKPLNGRGGIGTTIVDRGLWLTTAFMKAQASSTSRQVIVEKYISGPMVNVEGIYLGKHYNLMHSSKIKHQIYPANAMHLEYPSGMPHEIIKKIYDANDRVINAVGIDCGLTHSEFIIHDNEPYLVETHNRGCGVLVANTLIPKLTGIDIPELLIRQSLHENGLMPLFHNCERAGILHFFDFGMGYVKSIKGADKIPLMEGVLHFRLNIEPGSKLNPIETAIQRPGFVLITGKTKDESRSILSKVIETLHISTKPTSMIYSAMKKE